MRLGCSVRTNTLTRHSGTPQSISRAHISARTPCGVPALRAPSTSHSIRLRTSGIALLSSATAGEGKLRCATRMKDDSAEEHVDAAIWGRKRQHRALPFHIFAPADPEVAAAEHRAPLLHRLAPDPADLVPELLRKDLDDALAGDLLAGALAEVGAGQAEAKVERFLEHV